MGHTLIICEKPSAAEKIAQALSGERVKKLERNGAPYFRFKRKGKNMVVVPAVGHLFVLSEAESKAKWNYPVFEMK
jgi:DNA topoisomerase-1